jgi:hypothetical protein
MLALPADAEFPRPRRKMGALVPERVMVRAAGHWSNTASLKKDQCSYWRNGSCHSVMEG